MPFTIDREYKLFCPRCGRYLGWLMNAPCGVFALYCSACKGHARFRRDGISHLADFVPSAPKQENAVDTVNFSHNPRLVAVK